MQCNTKCCGRSCMCIFSELVHLSETHNPIYLLNFDGGWCIGGNEVIQTNAQNNKP
jgi:hypothetical protein